MEKDIFKERGRGMEEAYFRQQDRQAHRETTPGGQA